METEALPEVQETGASEQPENQQPEQQEAKPEKSETELRLEALERENKKLHRGIDRRTRQLYEARAEKGLTSRDNQNNNQDNANDSEPLSLTRAELAKYVQDHAEKLAPTLAEQKAEQQRRQGVIDSLAKSWGQDKFNEVASDLEEAFGGLQDRSGTPKPAIEAVFEAEDPQAVIEWLADPENADEAERISKLSAVRAGREIARLEAKLSANAAKAKPAPSKAPTPLEPVRGAAQVKSAPDPRNTAAWIAYQNELEAKGRL